MKDQRDSPGCTPVSSGRNNAEFPNVAVEVVGYPCQGSLLMRTGRTPITVVLDPQGAQHAEENDEELDYCPSQFHGSQGAQVVRPAF